MPSFPGGTLGRRTPWPSLGYTSSGTLGLERHLMPDHKVCSDIRSARYDVPAIDILV